MFMPEKSAVGQEDLRAFRSGVPDLAAHQNQLRIFKSPHDPAFCIPKNLGMGPRPQFLFLFLIF